VQVKRYLELYSVFAITGFPKQDLVRLEEYYTRARVIPDSIKRLKQLWMSAEDYEAKEEMIQRAVLAVRDQINAYDEFLSAAADLARSQWTQFGIGWMIVGLLILIGCIVFRAIALRQLFQSSSTYLDRLFPSTALLLGSLLCLSLTVAVVVTPSMPQTIIFTLVLGAAVLGTYYCRRAEGTSSEKSLKNLGDDQEAHQGMGSKRDSSGPVIGLGTVTSILLVTLHVMSLFSNSFIG
jgi:hypothetical protein